VHLLQLAAGVALDAGTFRPQGWRPFCPQQWLAEYLLQHSSSSSSSSSSGAHKPAAGTDTSSSKGA
jgi:hypothetical protein